MSPLETGWVKRHARWLITIAFAILLIIITLETAVLMQQMEVNRQIEAESEQALAKFLKAGQPPVTQGATKVLLRNVRFCWSQDVCINTDRLTARMAPLNGGNLVNVDAVRTFMVQIHNADVRISPKTLKGMFNESIFNYPDSNLRNLSVEIVRMGNRNVVELTGSLRYFLWIPFRMQTNLKADHKTNTLVIAVEKLRVFGFIPAMWLIQLKPFNLSKLLTVPPNNHLTLNHNLILVKPFGLFPPPRVNGHIENIAVMSNMIRLRFSGSDLGFNDMPAGGAKNYIYVYGGNTQFGRLQMAGTQIQVTDKNPGNLFQFSLLGYLSQLPASTIKMQSDGAVLVSMPDITALQPGTRQSTPKNSRDDIKKYIKGQRNQDGTDKPERKGFWGRLKDRLF